MTSGAPPGFDRYRRRAAQMVRSPKQLAGLAVKAAKKMATEGNAGSQLALLRRRVAVSVDLVRAWAAGDYVEVSRGSLITVVAALVYFLSPVDLVPDFLAVPGLLDDAAVLGFALGAVRSEILAFEAWRARTAAAGTSVDTASGEVSNG
jgi:uncharacterized membrane protein YkvA (DUF1232 family)